MIAKSCRGAAAMGLTGLLTLSVAHGAEIKREEGTLPSRFPYMINVPANWNGIVINDLDAVANKDGKFAAYLLDHGYAYTGTGRHPERMTRHDPLTELEAQVAVIKMVKEKFGQPKYTIQYGCSGGGYVTLAMAEKHRGHDRRRHCVQCPRHRRHGGCQHMARSSLHLEGPSCSWLRSAWWRRFPTTPCRPPTMPGSR